jgi:hypothetical protein
MPFIRTALAFAVAVGAWLDQTLPAHAFTTQSSQTIGCHERMAVAAVRGSGWPDGRTPPPLDEEGTALVDDSFYELPDDLRDPWSAALVIGVRHPDILDHDLADLAALAVEAGKPEAQRDHCLRHPAHDWAAGDADALAACRGRILEHVAAAIGADDGVDMGAAERVSILLVFRGATEVDLNRYAFRMGLALHALHDGFSHGFRKGARVTHVLNYVDYIERQYDERRDGHRHLSHLDRCSDDLEAQNVRVENATVASRDLLRAVASAEGGRDGRLERARAVLDAWMTLQPGCTYENAYCDAAELHEPAPGCTASRTSPGGATAWVGALALLGAALFARGRRRAAALAAAAASALGAPAARGEQADAPDPTAADGEEVEGSPSPWGLHLGAAGSLDQASLAAALGLRIQPVHWLTTGVDVELNPWLSIEGARAALGTTNVYLPFVFTWATLPPLELRSTLQLGVSVLNFDLVGADRGSFGPFAGTTPIGVAVRAGEVVRFVIDPGGLVVSVPQTRGIPIILRQHRLAVGLQLMW